MTGTDNIPEREDGHLDVLHEHLLRNRAKSQNRTLVLANSCEILKIPPLFLLPSSSYGGVMTELSKINCNSKPVPVLPKMQYSSHSSHTMDIIEKFNVLEGRSDFEK